MRVVVGELRRDNSPLLVLLVDTCDPASSTSGSHVRHHPAARYWTACTPHADGPDDEVERWHLWVDEVPDDESLDALMRLSATGDPTFIVTTETADWLCVVSENGVDVRLADETSRRQWRERFADWLPPPEWDPYPDGEHGD